MEIEEWVQRPLEHFRTLCWCIWVGCPSLSGEEVDLKVPDPWIRPFPCTYIHFLTTATLDTQEAATTSGHVSSVPGEEEPSLLFLHPLLTLDAQLCFFASGLFDLSMVVRVIGHSSSLKSLSAAPPWHHCPCSFPSFHHPVLNLLLYSLWGNVGSPMISSSIPFLFNFLPLLWEAPPIQVSSPCMLAYTSPGAPCARFFPRGISTTFTLGSRLAF